MVWVGDIDIPWITSKDTSISKEVVEKNFVDEPVQVFEKTAGLEAGTYTFILNEDVHAKSESFSEQIDAVESMPNRHGAEFPFELQGDQGHILVDTTTVSITPSEKYREAEANLRFLSKSDYQPGFKVEADPFNDVWDLTPVESVIPLHEDVSVVENSGGSISPVFNVDTKDGRMDMYAYDDVADVIEYERTSDYTADERVAPCELYNVNNRRIYSDGRAFGKGCKATNNYVEATFNDGQTDFRVYDIFNDWMDIGYVNLGGGHAYTPTNTNFEIEIDFIDSFNAFIYKGFPVVRFDFSGETKFEFTSNDTLDNFISSDYQVNAKNQDEKRLFLFRGSKDGSLSSDSSHLTWSGLDSSKSYTVWFGLVPARTFPTDLIRYLYSMGMRKRTFVQK